MKKHQISIVSPVYNEEEGIVWFHEYLCKELAKIEQYVFEVIYVNDGSKDGSLDALHALPAHNNIEIVVIDLSRNFGKEAALSAGLSTATGQAVIALDSDGQHPVEYIPEFIEKWRGGAEVVVGVRTKNHQEGFVKRYGSRVFYSAFNKITGTELVAGSTDYRLIDRKVVDEFVKLKESNRIARGLIDWLGFRREYLHFEANERKFGTAGYTFNKLVQLAINTFISLSAVPLFISGYVGLFFILGSLLSGIFVFIEQIILNDPLKLAITGTAMLALVIVFLVGFILAAQGLIGLYIARILSESQNRPLYIIRDKLKKDRQS